MHRLSVLQNANVVARSPFPHVVLDPALPQVLYNALAESRPTPEFIQRGKGGDNKRRDINACDFLPFQHGIASTWREFVAHHTSNRFWHELLDIFGPAIADLYPELPRAMGCPLRQARTGIRFVDETPVKLDCQIGLNTTPVERTRVRGPHVDNSKELFACMLYMRPFGDETPGGELILYRTRHHAPAFHDKAELHDEQVEPVASVPYGTNNAVAFLNTPRSIHGVGERPIGAPPRLLVNIIAELDVRLFSVTRDHR